MHHRMKSLHEWLRNGIQDPSCADQVLHFQDTTGTSPSDIFKPIFSSADPDLSLLHIQLSEFQRLTVHVDLWSGEYVIQSTNFSSEILSELQTTLNGVYTHMCVLCLNCT